MSTRSKAKQAAAAATASNEVKTAPTKATPAKADQKPKSRVSKAESEKENVKTKAKGNQKPTPAKRKSLRSAGPVYCTCQKGDDGTPMVRCEECKLWYHFSCVDMNPDDADDIHVYICPACHQASGLRTVYYYEGPDAVEEVVDGKPVTTSAPVVDPSPAPAPKKPKVQRDSPPPEIPSESDDDPSSADEYVADDEVKPRSKAANRRMSMQVSDGSDSEVDASEAAQMTRPSRFRKKDSTPSVGGTKRKARMSATPPPKRKKTEARSVAEDPARKYCLAKLEEVFREVFIKYHHVRSATEESNLEGDIERTPIERPMDELTEEEQGALIEEAKQFAADLEQAVFDIYCEPDKVGNPHAGPKYKDRFRMLQFNLSKPDRIVLHQRIVGGLLPPKEIAVMSSTDLASEEAKQSIKQAEQEALEHSILVPTTVPRAKITHKGLEDIEVVHETTALPDELSRSEEEERERIERVRGRTQSISIPPESPVVPQTPSWGGPPPIPLHAMSPSTPIDVLMPLLPLASPTTGEPDIDLSDFLNMDDDPMSNVDSSAQVPATPEKPKSDSPTGMADVREGPFSPSITSPTTNSFDLNSVWTQKQPLSTTPPHSPPADRNATGSPALSDKDMSIDSNEGSADDQDFDMFLEDRPEPPPPTGEEQQALFDALPQVWAGKISMPLDSTIPQETPVVARQIAGKTIPKDSGRWKVLFPASLFNIEGRVPVENSTKFLTQTKIANIKELLAVAFSPENPENNVNFGVLSDFLISKGRHGLVFPWGNRPKDHHPGRELYIIPLLSSDPVPEFLGLLDGLRLPKVRNQNLLIGLWVLNKGKLGSPPPPTPTQTSKPPFPLVSSIPKHTPTPPLIPPQPAPFVPPTPIPPSASPVTPAPLPESIINEVATLTPEQINLMIQTLQGSGGFPLPAVPPQPQGAPPPPIIPQLPASQVPPPTLRPPPVAPTPLSWPPAPPVQGYNQIYPPPPPPTMHAGPTPPHQANPGFYRRESWDRPAPQSPPRDDRHDRGARIWRGNGRGRGGRDRYSGAQDMAKPPVDNGWPRKPPRGGPPGQMPPRWG